MPFNVTLCNIISCYVIQNRRVNACKTGLIQKFGILQGDYTMGERNITVNSEKTYSWDL
jgi:hypothetical protein